MARLTAHGYEVARLDITRTMPDMEYRVIYSFRSDGHILRRQCSTEARGFDSGWKLYKKLRNPQSETQRRMAKIARAFADDAKDRGNDTTINAFSLHHTAL